MSTDLPEEESHEAIIRKFWYEILNWGATYMRKYPWRNDNNCYNILIAEVMLHRTRADQVKPVYESFIGKYPDFKSIVNSGQENIEQDLHPLGLTWRAGLLYSMAKDINEKYNGTVPQDRNELIKLSGVGDYIASAVLCFGFNREEVVLDTNIVRVIGRIFGKKVKDSSRRSKEFKSIMRELVSQGEPRTFTLSLIDFAALICKPVKPKCELCPIINICLFYKNSKNKVGDCD